MSKHSLDFITYRTIICYKKMRITSNSLKFEKDNINF